MTVTCPWSSPLQWERTHTTGRGRDCFSSVHGGDLVVSPPAGLAVQGQDSRSGAAPGVPAPRPGSWPRVSLRPRPRPLPPALSAPCPADYYSPSMLGLRMDQEVLGELVRTKLPAVAALMDGHGVLWTLVVSRWFICLFVDVLPVEVRVPRRDRGRGGGGRADADPVPRRRCSASGIVCSAKAPRSSSAWP